MNLAKAYCLTGGTQATFDQAGHGLKERLWTGGREFADAYLVADPSPWRSRLQNFAELKAALTGTRLNSCTNLEVSHLLPQILPGHRLWARAAKKEERFIALHDIQFWHDPTSRTLWLRIYLVADDLSRLSISHQRAWAESRLAGSFREVACDETIDDKRPLICLEQVQAETYPNGYPADYLHSVVGAVRPLLWMTVATVPPYRRYYLYLCPSTELPSLMEQLLSIYAVTFYLGSITRYRPHHYDALANGPYGPRILDFVTGQPLQFIYLMASEFLVQDVTKPSIL